jgi:hypothetical protein
MNDEQLKSAIKTREMLEKQVNEGNLKQVTSDEFFDTIGKLNVTVTPTGIYPYKTDFAYRNGEKVGYEHIGKYFLCI